MNWTDLAIIEQIPGKMSGAPVLRGTRLRPQDIVDNAIMGEDWIVDAFGVSLDAVRTVLAFHRDHREELPIEYFSPEHIAHLGADGIDWFGCSALVERGGEAVIRDTPVRLIDLIANAADGDAGLAHIYSLPLDTVRSVLSYYHQHKRQLAPAV